MIVLRLGCWCALEDQHNVEVKMLCPLQVAISEKPSIRVNISQCHELIPHSVTFAKGIMGDAKDSQGSNGILSSSNMWLASGACLGFALGWILRGRTGSSVFRKIRTVANYAAAHGNVPQTKLVLVARGDLDMSRGKLAAHCAHAAVGAVENFNADRAILQLWLSTGQAKVVLRGRDAKHLNDIEATCKASGLNAFLVHDAGRTELAAGTSTVLAVGPAEVQKIDTVTRSLKLL
ncbi:peptidyl-tRNA hydrolase 2, mitochondrial-like [Paramacrobiotus metropolitanus]|uniref:peptidyl-tRNA hydrolase 2, mitochondrial-like n=1 Tax=Paramacrobiotus metropolitanus TaxID=2943436 RepID=UPI002445D6EE|nr:peptidyl-tRNA hydrolase 2, mitochondrial-like [Paramacrobiotus metropolitanus]XP_055334578.1 peptidyl-tRNA hydrolase 2, mitochondrial-like [Paramacrobiotus metropolitanus]